MLIEKSGSLQFILFASLVAFAAAYPGGHYEGYEYAGLEAAQHEGAHHEVAYDYGQIARGDAHGHESHGHESHGHESHGHDEIVDYYVSYSRNQEIKKHFYSDFSMQIFIH